ncbi:MAG: phosphotransferase [Actinomycetia bacterium]|nr:phosphotransferase [Actinomycetes bacterium]
MGKRRHIPQLESEFTAQWLGEVLSPPGGTRLAGVRTEPVGHGIGFIGDLFRCHLQWIHSEQALAKDLPDSVIVKVPALHDDNRAVGEALQVYEREIVAYRDLGERMGLPMPQFHHADFDPHPAPWIDRLVEKLFTRLPVRGVNWVIMRFIGLSKRSRRRYVIVMEDIADARPPAQLDGGSIDDALAGLGVLAGFHATNWMSNETTEASELIWPIERTPRLWQASYIRNRDEFIERFRDVIGDELIARLDDVQERIPELTEVLGSKPWTLQHGDFRLDNILYRPDGSLVVVDFQLIGRGRAGWDVAYLITTALHPEHREAEEQMLRHYHNALVSAGVDDYPWGMFCSDVEASKMVLAHRMVCSSDVLNTQMSDQPDSFVDLLVKRVVGWI